MLAPGLYRPDQGVADTVHRRGWRSVSGAALNTVTKYAGRARVVHALTGRGSAQRSGFTATGKGLLSLRTMFHPTDS